jgi:hypothetical protein
MSSQSPPAEATLVSSPSADARVIDDGWNKNLESVDGVPVNTVDEKDAGTDDGPVVSEQPTDYGPEDTTDFSLPTKAERENWIYLQMVQKRMADRKLYTKEPKDVVMFMTTVVRRKLAPTDKHKHAVCPMPHDAQLFDLHNPYTRHLMKNKTAELEAFVLLPCKLQTLQPLADKPKIVFVDHKNPEGTRKYLSEAMKNVAFPVMSDPVTECHALCMFMALGVDEDDRIQRVLSLPATVHIERPQLPPFCSANLTRELHPLDAVKTTSKSTTPQYINAVAEKVREVRKTFIDKLRADKDAFDHMCKIFKVEMTLPAPTDS